VFLSMFIYMFCKLWLCAMNERVYYDVHVDCAVIGGCAPPDITNGIVVEKSGGGFIPGDRAVIQCDNGHVLWPQSAKPVIVCSRDGTWTTDELNLPSCIG